MVSKGNDAQMALFQVGIFWGYDLPSGYLT